MYKTSCDKPESTCMSTPGRLGNILGQGGSRTYDLRNAIPMLCQPSYAVRSVRVCDILKLGPVPSISCDLNIPNYTGSQTCSYSRIYNLVTDTVFHSFLTVLAHQLDARFLTPCSRFVPTTVLSLTQMIAILILNYYKHRNVVVIK